MREREGSESLISNSGFGKRFEHYKKAGRQSHGAAREVNKAMHRPGWQTAPAGRRAPLGLPPFWVAPHRLAYTTIRCCLRHCLIKCHPQSEPFSLGKRLAK